MITARVVNEAKNYPSPRGVTVGNADMPNIQRVSCLAASGLPTMRRLQSNLKAWSSNSPLTDPWRRSTRISNLGQNEGIFARTGARVKGRAFA